MALHHSSGRWRLGFSLALATASLWGVLPIALEIVLEAMDVYTVTWFRFLASFSMLAMLLASCGKLPSWRKLHSARVELLAIATLFLAMNYLLYLQGLVHTTPTNSQVIIQLAPVFMGLGALTIFKEHYTRWQWMGLGLLIFGISLFFENQLQALAHASHSYALGTGILVLAAATWAVYALAQKQLLQELSSAVIMLVIYGGSTLLFTPFATPEQILHLTPLQWGMLIFSGLNTLLAYGAFAEALDHWEASRVSAVLSLTPVITLISVSIAAFLFPTLINAEQINASGLFSAMLVVSGSLTIALGQRNQKQTQTDTTREEL